MTVQGQSGGGKTTTLRALHYTYPGVSVKYDIDEEPNFGREVHSVEELREAIAAGETEIVFRTPETVIENPDSFESVVRFLMKLGNRLRENPNAGKMQFLMGECQDLPEKWVKVAMKRLRKRRIKPVCETQDPFSLSNRIRTQARYQLWVSPPTNKQAESMRGTNWPIADLKQLPQHDALVFGEGWDPIARFRAPEEYSHD